MRAYPSAVLPMDIGWKLLSPKRWVKPDRYRKELLRDEGKIVGSLDGRYDAQDSGAAASDPSFDPASTAIENADVSTFSQYLAEKLGVSATQPYRFYNNDVSRGWA